MGHSQADKAASRERILAEAAAQIRSAGLDALSVGPLMRSVGLTHGGFYGHFESRADLLAQARLRTEASARALAKAGAPAPVRAGMAALKRALASHHGQWSPVRAQAVANLLQRAAADIAAAAGGD